MKALLEVIKLDVSDIVTISVCTKGEGELVDECDPDFE